jgi:hypothetical protein
MAPPPGMPLLRHSVQASDVSSAVASGVGQRGAPSSAEADPSEPVLDRSQWERIALSPDIELHVRRPLTRAHQKGVDRLVTIARELLEEDRS